MIRIASSPGEHLVALLGPALSGPSLLEYRIWRPGAPDAVGETHVGRVVAVVPAMAGRFVALAEGEAFLPDTECEAPGVGELLTLRITRAAQGGKGPRVTARVAQQPRPERVGRLAPGPTPVEALAARHPEAPIVVESRALAAALAPAFPGRVRQEAPAFDEALAAEIEALESPDAVLPGGMRAVISPTPALTAIDVDAGGATAAREGKARAQFAANLAAIPELARQIRLRNLSGAILLDFAGVTAGRRRALGPALRAALEADARRPRLLGFTALGLAEILRPRRHPPLHELLAGPHAAGLSALRRIVADHAPDTRLVLRAAPAVVAALEADPVAMRELGHHTQGVALIAEPRLGGCGWRVEVPDGR